MKAKTETEEQKLKRHAREARELARLEKEYRKPKGPLYLIYFIFVISVIYIADEVTTQIGTQMQYVIASQVFAPLVGADVAVARMSLIGTISLVASGLAYLYKPLSDRYGRKLFLVINTIGMGIGLVLVGISTNIPVYLLGTIVIAFFTPHDMQAIYIMESAPAKHRAKLYSVIKCVATLGMFMIPLLRNIFITETDLSRWRFVYYLPAAMTLLISLIAMFCIRESDAFLVSRIALLKMSDEEREAARASHDATQEQGGLISGLKLTLTNRQLRSVTLSNGLLMFGMIITSYYETVMTYGYAQKYTLLGMTLAEATQMATADATKALFIFPFSSAALQLIPGFIADKWGRRVSAMVMALLSIVTYLLFFIGCSGLGWSPYLVGAFCGAAIGSYWSSGDMVSLIASESAPTNMRVSVTTVSSLLSGIIYGVAYLATIILINVFGDAKIGLITLLIAMIGSAIGLVMLFATVKDTKGIDLGTVTGKEFE